MTRETIYGFIAAEKTTYPVRLLCRVLQVSASASYDWIRRGRPAVSDGELDDAHAATQLRDGWVEHRRTYGARRLTAEIRDRDPQGQAWNRKKAARLMTVAGIEGAWSGSSEEVATAPPARLTRVAGGRLTCSTGISPLRR